ncbi:PEP-CTERM sorting domain-containing protein [Aquincola sp. S2]|uniref:PEP-CTERM sorting domain-containing protein n=1 Tax=Pseudaquabacterium terrae TaxID=2732868 RepID=A0ABX2ESH3_9BURK|nr:PEP-CTERM sorting domain-containing protein [Aquabacterium terrae]NRF71467.1 PEP-CTERM sorting domain-containing protein [Aquabacterium terrae]
MREHRTLFMLAVLAATALLPARAAPVLDLGVAAYLALDAGNAHWFVNLADAGPTAGTGLVTQGIADTKGGGAQTASTSAYASVGALGGRGLTYTSGAFHSAQAADDLSWYADLLITGTPGEKVTLQFATTLDGFVAGSGFGPGSAFGGGVTSRTFVAGNVLADWSFASGFGTPALLIDELALVAYEFDVGSVIRVASRLTVLSHAHIESAVETNALDTSTFFVDVLTPGGGYVAGGGFVFPTLPPATVPEPAPVLLLALAAMAAASASRRARQGQRARLECARRAA